MGDRFFEQKECDRCGGELKVRTCSWFTEEAICMDCSAKEDVIKAKLRAMGETGAREGCGYIPQV